MEQSKGAVVYPNVAEMAAVEEYGSGAYAAIQKEPTLSEEELDALVGDMTEAINAANGSAPKEPEQEELSNGEDPEQEDTSDGDG